MDAFKFSITFCSVAAFTEESFRVSIAFFISFQRADVAAGLPEYHLKHYHVTRRIQRMNRRLEHEISERLFEKRGWKWALTNFGVDIWGETEKESVSCE